MPIRWNRSNWRIYVIGSSAPKNGNMLKWKWKKKVRAWRKKIFYFRRRVENVRKVGIVLPRYVFFVELNYIYLFGFLEKFRKRKSALSGIVWITVLPENSRYPIYTANRMVITINGMRWDYVGMTSDNNSCFEQLHRIARESPHPHQNGNKKHWLRLVRWCLEFQKLLLVSVPWKNVKTFITHIET